MANRKKGQVSTEMLALVGLMLFLLLPLLFYAYSRSNVASEDIAVQKAEFAAQRLASAADSVGYMGGAAAVVEELEIPANVKKVSIENGHDIVLEIDSSSGRKQLVKSSAFMISSSGFDRIEKAGIYFFEVRALSNYAANGSATVAQVGITVR